MHCATRQVCVLSCMGPFNREGGKVPAKIGREKSRGGARARGAAALLRTENKRVGGRTGRGFYVCVGEGEGERAPLQKAKPFCGGVAA